MINKAFEIINEEFKFYFIEERMKQAIIHCEVQLKI